MLADKIDNRLYAVGNCVRTGGFLADVGTDHGYLICHLTQQGKIVGGIAADVNELPLQKAEKLVAELNLTEKIQTRLSDGLRAIGSHEVDDIAIAGMGGELIIKILSECDWAKDSSKNFILQPQTKAFLLRRYLYNEGYEIQKEDIASVGKFYYTIMTVSYTGNSQEVDEFFAYTGKIFESSQAERFGILERIARDLTLKGENSKDESFKQEYRAMVKKITAYMEGGR